MPVTLKLTFPGGRYHATPWGRHVNEGVAEWPPAPWRLLRALVATWKRKCPDLPEEQVRRVLVPLLKPPRFHLPPARVAHTRHYMPLNTKLATDVKGGGTTLVFDTFVSVGRSDALLVDWPDADLPDADRAALARLAENLTTLGRAEGWVHAELTTETAAWNCAPAATGGSGEELVPVFCPDPATALAGDHYPPADPKKRDKDDKKGGALFDCPRWHLCLDTELIHNKQWPRVPGAVWVSYARPGDGFTRRATAPVPAAPVRPDRPTVARFLLDGPVLPPVTDTVRVAEAFRLAAMSQFGRWCRARPAEGDRFRRTDDATRFSSPTLSGRLPNGDMRMDHAHAHYLPTAEGADRHRVTHVTVFAEEGFGPGEVAALTAVREVVLAAGGDRANVARAQLTGLGPVDLFRGSVSLFRRSAVWVSLTPFVAHRHPKRRGTKRDAPAFEPEGRTAFAGLSVRELVAHRNLGVLIGVSALPEVAGRARPAAFERGRARPRDDGWARPHGVFKLAFDSPISGPVCLGYACHYGLGLFRPPDDRSEG